MPKPPTPEDFAALTPEQLARFAEITELRRHYDSGALGAALVDRLLADGRIEAVPLVLAVLGAGAGISVPAELAAHDADALGRALAGRLADEGRHDGALCVQELVDPGAAKRMRAAKRSQS